MRGKTKIVGLLLMMVLMTSLATAAFGQDGKARPAGTQLRIGALDAVTAADAGGGALIGTVSTVILIILILAVIGLISLL